jgi:single-stranded-DNA-specific exonuclease
VREAAEWHAAPVPEVSGDLEAAGLPAWLAGLLARRGVSDAAAAHRFLEPSADQLHDPFLLEGMEGAVERLMTARAQGEVVAIVGDYDVDGVTSTAILLAVFRAVGLQAHAILPNRLREGYGFQPLHADRARDLGCSLIVTADCGSSSIEAVMAATALGIDVVVTDHHLPQIDLPPAILHLNPRLPGCRYPCRDLAAVGIALKLALALTSRCGRSVDLDALLRIACLGTIADLVPLSGENRVIAALGLRALASPRSQGLKALFEQAGVKSPPKASDIGFRVGPRLNAAGRLDEADRALELLLCRDPERAREIAAELETYNRDRQSAELTVVEEARQHFAGLSALPNILVAASPSWHKGVVGIAAGRLAKEFHRPTLLLAQDGETATGSGRSLRGIELHAFLAPWKGEMLRFGGHAQAIGLTVAMERLEGLRAEWESAADSWAPELLTRRHEYELELRPAEITETLWRELERLEPFGQGNSRPLVRSGPLSLGGSPRLFGRGHLAVTARGEEGTALELLGWGWAERAGELTGTFEVLGHLERDVFRGGLTLQLVDARPV